MSPDDRPLDDEQEERLGGLLREALHREAQHVPVSDDGLARIRTRTGGTAGAGTAGVAGAAGPWRQPRTWIAAAAAAVVVSGGVAVGLGALSDHGSSSAVDPAQSASMTPAPSAPPSATSATQQPSGTASGGSGGSGTTTAVGAGSQLTGVPVYWLGQQGSQLALFREFQSLAAYGPGAASLTPQELRLQAAVTAAVSGHPTDPDYLQVWAAGSAARATVAGRVITIDLNDAAAGSSLGSQAASLAVQQLVWTATAALGQNLPVRLTVNGQSRDLFGSVSTARPFTRQTGTTDPRAAVWIDDPAQGATVSGSFTARGSGINAFENTLTWKVIQGHLVYKSGQLHVVGANGKPVDTGQRGTWSLPLNLPSGQYRLEVSVPDASGGASTVVRVDSKDFTVR